MAGAAGIGEIATDAEGENEVGKVDWEHPWMIPSTGMKSRTRQRLWWCWLDEGTTGGGGAAARCSRWFTERKKKRGKRGGGGSREERVLGFGAPGWHSFKGGENGRWPRWLSSVVGRTTRSHAKCVLDDLEEDDTRRSISARTGTQKRWAEEKRGWARRGEGRLGRSG
jgi:hypothetical protein